MGVFSNASGMQFMLGGGPLPTSWNAGQGATPGQQVSAAARGVAPAGGGGPVIGPQSYQFGAVGTAAMRGLGAQVRGGRRARQGRRR